MKKFLQILTILTLMIWGGMFLYFYLSGRIEKYLDPSFRIYALISGVGLLLLAAFNFLNRDRETGVCTHDHNHGDECHHDHHTQDHSHGHECKHDHSHENGPACDHDHTHEQGATCDHGHDHVHGPDCDHDHSHHHGETAEAAHVHTHDHEDTPSGIAFSLLVLLVPLLVATGYSKDRFSSEYLAKWGKIERQMMQMRIARNSEAKQSDTNEVSAASNPYTREGIDAATPGTGDTPPEPESDEKEATPSWNTFTMDDLKNMVPQNDKGEFLLDVPQIFYTAGDKELMEVMEGIPVETTAQLMEETLHNPNKTRLKAFRLFIECCAADARPLSIPIDFGKTPPPYVDMGWYKIYGKLHYANEDGEIIPLLQVERIDSTVEPTDGLLF